MRLRPVFHAFALGVLMQSAAAAQAPLADVAGLIEGGRSSMWGLDLVAVGEYVAGAPPLPLPLPLRVRVPAPIDLAAEKLADEESYMDVYHILKEENSCSRFFGGSAGALEAFNDFARQLRKKALGDGALAIRMKGRYTIYRNNLTGASFRLFEEAAINSNGPFFIRIPFAQAARVHIGRFLIPSRGARALTLLHELGHLVRGADGEWLLPNDGGDRRLSERNTREVEGRCLEQLMTLGD
ncbi:MAG: hypothetical protein LC802_11815 [Acidobacteria bacterium]|nr:hypothetical protein [Acidobacteriota bacterium]